LQPLQWLYFFCVDRRVGLSAAYPRLSGWAVTHERNLVTKREMARQKADKE
jgi:hypothetical protein